MNRRPSQVMIANHPNATLSTPAVNAARLARSRRRRAEERVACAILHASSHCGIFALAASSVVWATHRTRSRFVAFQALQAMMFQFSVLLALLLTFGLFTAGFAFAAFSGLIARTGVTEPELTLFLTVAAILGFASIFFFQWIFPLWGVWAAVQTLCGRNFRYPILSRLAVNWSTGRPTKIEASSVNQRVVLETPSETVLAGLGHLSVLGGLSPILAPILWTTAGNRSQFLSYYLFQAALFQLLLAGVTFAWFFCFWGLGVLLGLFGGFLPAYVSGPVALVMDSPVLFLSWLGVLGTILLIKIISALTAAIRAFMGREFRYPIVGSWLANYLNTER